MKRAWKWQFSRSSAPGVLAKGPGEGHLASTAPACPSLGGRSGPWDQGEGRGDSDTRRQRRGAACLEGLALRVPLGPWPEPSSPQLGGLGQPRQGKEVPGPLLRGLPARPGDLGLGPGWPPISV